MNAMIYEAARSLQDEQLSVDRKASFSLLLLTEYRPLHRAMITQRLCGNNGCRSAGTIRGITPTNLGWLAWLDQHHGVETDRTSVGIHG
jgi:hypothetical protein